MAHVGEEVGFGLRGRFRLDDRGVESPSLLDQFLLNGAKQPDDGHGAREEGDQHQGLIADNKANSRAHLGDRDGENRRDKIHGQSAGASVVTGQCLKQHQAHEGHAERLGRAGVEGDEIKCGRRIAGATDP